MRWKDGTESRLKVLLTALSKTKREESGAVVFDGFAFDRYAVPLLGCIEPPKGILEDELLGLLQSALFRVRGAEIDPELLMKECNSELSKIRRRKRRPYVLATNLSIRNMRDLKRVVFNGAVMTFTPNLPKQFDRDEAERRYSHYITSVRPRGYIAARVHVLARTPQVAFQNATDALDTIRGMWVLRQTMGRFQSSSGIRKPISKIVAGPVSTLHDGNGASENLWSYQDLLPLPAGAFLSEKQVRNIKDYEDWVRRQLKKCHYHTLIEECIRRYVRALDSTDWEKSILSLWAVVEELTDSSALSKDSLGRRVSFLFSDNELHRAIVGYLREYRNKIAHGGHSTRFEEAVLCHVKNYAEFLLSFHLKWGGELGSFRDVVEMLAQPSSLKELNRKSEVLKAAIKFTTHSP